MGTVTLLIVAASALGACIASIGLLRIYNERPIWHPEEAKRSAVNRRRDHAGGGNSRSDPGPGSDAAFDSVGGKELDAAIR
jgi:hypothetical protein